MIWLYVLAIIFIIIFIIVYYFGLFKRLLLLELLKGMWTPLSYLTKTKSTVQFPEESLPRSVRHRGMLALRRYENGDERCIACKLCESVCPALAITIETLPADRSDDIRKTKRFDIDMFKCINCGLCEEACPVDSIVLTPNIHYVAMERGQNILTKEKLLAIGDKYEEKLAQDREQDSEYR